MTIIKTAVDIFHGLQVSNVVVLRAGGASVNHDKNNTIERVTHNLDEITLKLNSSKSLWILLLDTFITRDLKRAVSDSRDASAHTAALTLSAKTIVDDFEEGDGFAATLFAVTTLTRKLDNSMTKLQTASEKTAVMMTNLESPTVFSFLNTAHLMLKS